MDLPLARSLADQQVVLAQQLVTALAPDANVIRTPNEFDRALSAAVTGDTLSLDPSFVYPGPAVIDKAVTVRNAGPYPTGRMTPDAVLPHFLSGLALTHGAKLLAVDVRQTDPLTDIVVATGEFGITQCRILGDPTKGAKRGIQANPTSAVITSCYIDDCFQASPGMDSQAIACWNGGGLAITDNFLRAASETILLGGADSDSAATMPHDITIQKNLITANPLWQGQAIGVKTRLEFKACRNVVVQDNDVEYCWLQGQVGYLLTLNVRNQDGTAPWSTIANVIITGNRFKHGCAAISLLGHDDAPHLSGTMSTVTISDNDWSDLDPVKYGGGTDKLIQMLQPTMGVTIHHNTFAMASVGSQLYFDGPPSMASGFVVTDNTWPASTYGIFGSAGTQTHDNTPAPGSSWAYFTQLGTLSGNVTV
jgi:hypothetical protein